MSRNYRTEFFSKFFIDGNELRWFSRLPTSIKLPSQLPLQLEMFQKNQNESKIDLRVNKLRQNLDVGFEIDRKSWRRAIEVEAQLLCSYRVQRV